MTLDVLNDTNLQEFHKKLSSIEEACEHALDSPPPGPTAASSSTPTPVTRTPTLARSRTPSRRIGIGDRSPIIGAAGPRLSIPLLNSETGHFSGGDSETSLSLSSSHLNTQSNLYSKRLSRASLPSIVVQPPLSYREATIGRSFSRPKRQQTVLIFEETANEKDRFNVLANTIYGHSDVESLKPQELAYLVALVDKDRCPKCNRYGSYRPQFSCVYVMFAFLLTLTFNVLVLLFAVIGYLCYPELACCRKDRQNCLYRNRPFKCLHCGYTCQSVFTLLAVFCVMLAILLVAEIAGLFILSQQHKNSSYFPPLTLD